MGVIYFVEETYMSLVKSLLCLRCFLKVVTRLCEYRLQQMFAHYMNTYIDAQLWSNSDRHWPMHLPSITKN